jgi:Ca2+-transporting ATPase
VADWYRKETSEIISLLNTDAGAGLAPPEAQRRPWRILWEQLTGLMIVILIVAAVVAGALGDWQDAIAILAIAVAVGTVLAPRFEKPAPYLASR